MSLNPAEYRVLREGLGLSPRDVSMLTLVPEEKLKVWELGSEPVPDGVAGLMLDIERELESRVARALEKASGDAPLTLVLFRNPLDFKRHGPSMAPIPPMLAYKCHGTLIARLYRALKAAGRDVSVRYFAPEA